MAKNCDLIVYKALQGVLDKDEVKKIMDDIRDKATQKARDETIDLTNALVAVKKDLEAEEVRAAKIRKRNEYLSIIARNNIFKRLDLFKTDVDGMKSLLDGVQKNIKLSRYSTVSQQRAGTNKILSQFWAKIQNDNLIHIWNDSSLSEELANESFTPGYSKNPGVVKLAVIFKDTANALVKELNAHGADIGINENYIARTSHNRLRMLQTARNLADRIKLNKQYLGDAERLRTIAYERWRDFISPLLDAKKTFKGADAEKFLRSAYDAITSGVRLDPPDGAPKKIFKTGTKPSTNLASRISQERVLHFKDGSSWFKYNNEYGYGDMRSAIIKGFTKGSEQLGLLKVWGPNPEQMYHDVMRSLLKRNRENPKTLAKLRSLESTFNQITGTASFAVNPKISQYAGALRRIQSLSKLGGVVISSLPDIETHASTLRYNGVGYLNSYFDTFNTLLSGKPSGEVKQIAELIGLSAEHILGETGFRFSAEDSQPGTFSKLEQSFFKLNGMQWWDEVHRSGAGVTLSRWLAQNKHLDFEALDPRLKNSLGLYGIGDQEWSIIRQSVTKAGGKDFITPDKLPSLSKSQVAKLLGKDTNKITNKDMDFVTKNVEDKLRNYFYDQIDHVILNARPSDRALLLGGSQAGTLGGEALRFIAQFKMYSVAFFRRIIMRELTGTYDGKASVQNLMQIVIGATGLGYLSIAAHDVIDGKTPSPPSYKTFIRSLERGGGLGIMGDLMFGDFSDYGHGAAQTIIGPTFGTIFDTINLASKSRDYVFGNLAKKLDLLSSVGNLDDPRAAALSLAKNNIPLMNLWYTKTGLNYLFWWGLHERASPGYLRRMTNAAEKNGQNFYYNPTIYANQF